MTTSIYGDDVISSLEGIDGVNDGVFELGSAKQYDLKDIRKRIKKNAKVGQLSEASRQEMTTELCDVIGACMSRDALKVSGGVPPYINNSNINAYFYEKFYNYFLTLVHNAGFIDDDKKIMEMFKSFKKKSAKECFHQMRDSSHDGIEDECIDNLSRVGIHLIIVKGTMIVNLDIKPSAIKKLVD